jgi:hypothetical protein
MTRLTGTRIRKADMAVVVYSEVLEEELGQ